ncbi:hypothetical protein [Demequina aurantiaca]|uniref:hypothetical protein n=1 Tax=Demequina aurantiaca TaxID=676200 RepID=UPI003D33BCA1
MKPLILALVAALILAGCSPDPEPTEEYHDQAESNLIVQTTQTKVIGVHTEVWQQAATIEEAHAAAESALNLVVGADGPHYGDADGDGSIGGETVAGLLPGLDGEPGVAQIEPINECVERDVLGGSWDDPAARWAEADAALAAWSPSDNTMPTLASHPQRIYGWASLTLATDDLDEAHEYAGHALIHVNVTLDAFENCS